MQNSEKFLLKCLQDSKRFRTFATDKDKTRIQIFNYKVMIQIMNTVSSQTTQLDYRMCPAEKLEIAETLDG